MPEVPTPRGDERCSCRNWLCCLLSDCGAPASYRDLVTTTVDGAAAAAEGAPDLLTGLFPSE